ncbi:hypothetical protein QAD02_010610 [Eretmocerus hayati]|uniref:Uncharacterized protein n=1 Tax=Eretmocerus hayati TaxID=131215 RepID=A0ACC2NX18_9HYME|nr:hypothetical protein QAD02_010610 [Eretmocerus hayati]
MISKTLIVIFLGAATVLAGPVKEVFQTTTPEVSTIKEVSPSTTSQASSVSEVSTESQTISTTPSPTTPEKEVSQEIVTEVPRSIPKGVIDQTSEASSQEPSTAQAVTSTTEAVIPSSSSTPKKPGRTTTKKVPKHNGPVNGPTRPKIPSRTYVEEDAIPFIEIGGGNYLYDDDEYTEPLIIQVIDVEPDYDEDVIDLSILNRLADLVFGEWW